jgi:hypothetical protein
MNGFYYISKNFRQDLQDLLDLFLIFFSFLTKLKKHNPTSSESF